METRKSKSMRSEQVFDDDGGLNMPEPPWPHQQFIHDVVTSAVAEAASVTLIFVSVACVVVETDRAAVNSEPLLGVDVVNAIILGVYTADLLCKVYIYRGRFHRCPWNLLDFFVVFADYTMLLVDSFADTGFSMKFLRVLRLARLTRSARVVAYFPQLALMVQGLYGTLRIVLSGLLLLMGVLVIIGVLGVQLLHPVNQRVAEKGLYEGCERCPRAFESTFNAAITFAQQIICGDSWGLLSLPIIEEDPTTIFFMGAVFIGLNLMVMNVILSMVVDSSLKASEEDTKRLIREKEKEKMQQADTLQQMCADLDEDQSGLLTKAELLHGFESIPAFREMMTLMDFSMEDLDAIFGVLDGDGSGDVNYEEFVKMLYKMKTNENHTLLVFIKLFVAEVRDYMHGTMQAEFEHLNKAVGVNESAITLVKGQKKSGEEKASQMPAIRKDSVHDILQDLRQGVMGEVSQLIQELAQKSADNHANLLQLLNLAPPPADGGIGTYSSRAFAKADAVARASPPAPRGVPQPLVEEDGKPPQAADGPPAARAPPHQLGPMCHYVGKAKPQSVHTSGAFEKPAALSQSEQGGPQASGGPPPEVVRSQC